MRPVKSDIYICFISLSLSLSLIFILIKINICNAARRKFHCRRKTKKVSSMKWVKRAELVGDKVNLVQ